MNVSTNICSVKVCCFLSHVGCVEHLAPSVYFFVCLFDTSHSRRKMAGTIDTKLGAPIARGRTSACSDCKVKVKFFFAVCILSMVLLAWELHVDLTAVVLVKLL